jgi:NAD(P)-dependent dehydrogenase (short-subunit alcohol dehydrogenase family)
MWRDPIAFGRWLGDIKTQSPVKALIHLGPVDDPVMPDSVTLEQWQERTARDVRSLFPLLQTSADDLQRDGIVITASAMGGLFARGFERHGSEAWPIAAGNIGLLKCLSLEWHGCRFKAVDLDPAEPIAAQAGHLFRELFLGCGRREVGYPSGHRTIFRTEPAFLRSLPDAARTPDNNWVVLAIGGAHGVTAETLRDVAQFGPKLVLVGRSKLPEPEGPETAGLETQAALRQHFIAHARALGESVAPREIERRVASILRAREMRANLADLERLGADVEYRSVDMCNREQVQGLVEELYVRFGRIDAVYFGIGLLEDGLLVNKKADSVARVMATKIDSAFLLSQCLRPEDLKFFGFFTSVAGRYGNRGQTDYGAANEILNQFAWILSRRWGPKVKIAAINWGPWAGTTHGTGMVTPEVRKQFEARGVSLIEPAEGRAYMTRELMYGPTKEVESVAGNDPWDYLEASHAAMPALPSSKHPDASLPLISTGTIHAENGTTKTLRKRIDLVSDPYLDHHRIDGVPVLPFMVVTEMMAETASLLDPDVIVTELRDVHLLSGISLEHGAIDIEIRARRDGNVAAIECWVMGDKPRIAYRGKAHLAERIPAESMLPPRAADGGAPVRIGEAYRDWLFHGPLFQTVTAIDALDERRMRARARPSNPQSFYPPAKTTAWMFDPGITDGALQLLLVWSRVMRDETALPLRIARLARFGARPLAGPLVIAVTFNSSPQESAIECDIVIADEGGNIRMVMIGVEGMSSASLNRISGGWTGESVHKLAS